MHKMKKNNWTVDMYFLEKGVIMIVTNSTIIERKRK